jgi:acetolactate synthase I/II/III large subunit
VIATDLKNPDFVKWAEAFGAFGVRCETTDAFPEALETVRREARERGVPALLHLITSAEDIAPNRTISGMRGG